jgi:serine/threonine-protein phosphatase 6 regulatory subunit 3
MSLLNRPADYDYLYDTEGRLQGGLSALEELAQVISMGSSEEENRDNMDEEVDEAEPALEFPVHGAPQDSSSILDSDEDMSDDEGPGSFEDDPMEDITAPGELKPTDGGSKPKAGPPPHIPARRQTPEPVLRLQERLYLRMQPLLMGVHHLAEKARTRV